MNCERCIERLPEYLFDTLPQREHAELRQHLDTGCPRCREELDTLTSAASLLAEGLDPVAPGPELKRALFDRIADGSRPGMPPRVGTGPLRRIDAQGSGPRGRAWRSFFPYAAACLGALIVGAWAASVSDREARLGQEVMRARVAEWQERMDLANRTFGEPRLTLTTLEADFTQRGFHCVFVYDKLASQIHAVVFGVPSPADGRIIHVWLLDRQGETLSSGPLDTRGGVRANGLFDLPVTPDNIFEVVFTEEAIGEHPGRPSDTAVIARTRIGGQ